VLFSFPLRCATRPQGPGPLEIVSRVRRLFSRVSGVSPLPFFIGYGNVPFLFAPVQMLLVA